jgi:osmotically-inducible protein OsmY
MRKDKDLQADVMQQLTWEPGVDSASIGVGAAGGAITLFGHVKSYAEKVAANRAAKRVYGVRAVADELLIEPPHHHLHDDTDIAETVARVLDSSAKVPKGAVRAKVSNGWVTLEGRVDWDYQAKAASDQVRGLTGVLGVSNFVVVKGSVRYGKNY